MHLVSGANQAAMCVTACVQQYTRAEFFHFGPTVDTRAGSLFVVGGSSLCAEGAGRLPGFHPLGARGKLSSKCDKQMFSSFTRCVCVSACF